MKWFLIVAIFFAVSALMLDAFFAHGLKKFLAENYTDASKDSLLTAARYQFNAAIFMLVVVLFAQYFKSPWLLVSELFSIVGVAFFSVSIYLKYLAGLALIPFIAPLGGICFMLSFLSLLPLFFSL